MNSDNPIESSTDPITAQLSEIRGLLHTDPAVAVVEAGKLLEQSPELPGAMLFQGIAYRRTGNFQSAVDVLTKLCRTHPEFAPGRMQLGLALRELGDHEAAADVLRKAVNIQPDLSDAWLALAELLFDRGDRAGADEAFCKYAHHSTNDPRLLTPVAALRENRIEEAESLLRAHLDQHPSDIVALGMLAEVATKRGRLDTAETLLGQCLERAPGYAPARFNYAVVLMRREKCTAALQQCEELIRKKVQLHDVRNLKAAILVRLGNYDQAIEIYQALLQDLPDQPVVWMSLGHALRTVGRIEECIGAYRKTIQYAPRSGEPYWSLANLKTYSLSDRDLGTMQRELSAENIPDKDRIQFHFAIGKALEDRGRYDESFQHYQEGNRLRRGLIRYKADEATDYVRRCKNAFTEELFARHAGSGAKAADPIFIVGLPRTGSTLLEQILSSHSQVEATTELPHIMALSAELSVAAREQGGSMYPESLDSLDRDALSALGEEYLERAGMHRKLGRTRFIDKMPNNFAHTGLIHLILPNARIVDARRHPMACGVSIFRHLFAHGQNFSYSLEDIGRYYRDYVELMDHFDRVLPGRVHRVFYESMVTDFESEVRRLLDYCGLPFEAACLAFHQNKRAVSTPSSEQVRSPIYTEGMEQWRRFEPWLAPLKAALGPSVDTYPAALAIPNASH